MNFEPKVKMTTIDRSRIKKLTMREEGNFIEQHPKSKALFERAKESLLAGVPMNWMVRWAGTFPVFVKDAKDASVLDIDGRHYVDFCLGDTGAMFGHSPKPVVDAVIDQVRHGITMMLPTEDSIWVGKELARRFGLPYWQLAMTATDANRFAIRLAREATKRKKILVFNGCYHGSVDETLVDLKLGLPVSRRGNIGPPVDPQVTTKVIEFNDIESLDNALSPQDVAAVVCEPAMTNRGIILPEPNYHETLRLLTRRYGALLIVDETHTICCGPGGYTAEHNLDPDIVTIGKPIASGVPGAAYGISQEVANKIISKVKMDTSDESGIGGTLSGNALAVAAIKATLEHVITKEAFDYMVPLAERFADGIERTIKAEKLPWHVTRLGVRVEYAFRPTRPKNGGEAEASKDPELDKLMHVYALNRGILLTPFHNMALISPYHSIADVDFHTKVFQECVLELTQ